MTSQISLTPAERAKIYDLLNKEWTGEEEFFTSRKGVKFIPNSEAQTDFIRSAAPFVGMFGGRGSGKTTAGSQKAIRKISQGESGMIISPDMEHLKLSTWPEFKNWVPWHKVLKHDQRMAAPEWVPRGPFEIHFQNGARVILKGVKDPESARGPNINWLWYDEGGRDRLGEAFDLAVAGVRVGHNPQAWVTTTPKGVRHWLYELFILKKIPPEALAVYEELGLTLAQLIQAFFGSIKANKDHLDPLYYARMLALYSGKFAAQELEGKFVEIAAGVVLEEEFSEENITLAEPIPGHPIELALDHGYIDPFVILFIQKFPDRILVFDEIYISKKHADQVVQMAVDRINSWPWPMPEAGEWIQALKQLVKTPQNRHPQGSPPDLLEAYMAKLAKEHQDKKTEGDPEFMPNGSRKREGRPRPHYPTGPVVGSPEAKETHKYFRRANIRVRNRQSEWVKDRIPKIRTLVKDGNDVRTLMIHSRCEHLLGEITDTWRYPDNAQRDSEKPMDGNDHCVEALSHWIYVRT